MRFGLAALLLLAGLTGPLGAQPAGVPVGVAQPVLTRIALHVATAKGVRRFRVEVAATPRQQQVGMMFRTRIGRGNGMLFPFETPRELSFWMENTLVSLDLIYIGTDRRVLSIAANAVPRSRDFIPSRGIAAAVLEIGAGEAARLGIRPGDRVDYRLPQLSAGSPSSP